MKKHILFVSALTIALQAQAREALCFIAGAMGGGSHLQEDVIPELAKQNVPMHFFSGGQLGSIETRAGKIAQLLNRALQEDPDLQCHFMGHSMGGLILRYAANHLNVQHPHKGQIPFHKIAASMASLAAPHQGTPLASLIKGAQATIALGVFKSGLEQLSEDGVRRFNTPGSRQYSPEIAGIPFFGYRGYIAQAGESSMILENLGFRLLRANLLVRGRDAANDGLVPTTSQSFGKTVATLHVPHMFFSRAVPAQWGKPEAFYMGHWNLLHGATVEEAMNGLPVVDFE